MIDCKCKAEARDMCVCNMIDRLAVEISQSSLEHKEFNEFQDNLDRLFEDWTYEGNSI